MNAAEARVKTEAAKSAQQKELDELFDRALELAEANISAAADRGEYSCMVRIPSGAGNRIDAHLKSEGYRVLWNDDATLVRIHWN